MFKKTITYTDYNDTIRTEDFYFNLSKAELAEMDLSVDGGLENYINKILSARDVASLTAVFKDLILKAYGEKSPDGRRFIKSKDLSDSFSQTEAYSDLFMELATNTDSATAFINGITPNVESVNKSEISKQVSEKLGIVGDK